MPHAEKRSEKTRVYVAQLYSHSLKRKTIAFPEKKTTKMTGRSVFSPRRLVRRPFSVIGYERRATARVAPTGKTEDHTMELPKRKQIRLSEYDYSAPGAYFVTVCTRDRRCVLSDIRRGDPCGRPSVIPTEYGKIVEHCLKQTEALYAVRIEPYVIMPNHIHFICAIGERREAARVAPALGRIIGALKSLAANRCREAGLKGTLWQRGYYEHVIRNERDLREIWDYIDSNPARWAEDRYYQI